MLKLFFITIITCLTVMACNQPQTQQPESWCNQKPRAQFSTLKQVLTSRPWFKVYNVGNNVYAIAEPYNYQEVICYLIIGRDKALLFDTGMGLDSISLVVKELTKLPVIVINSHTHYDHTGGNAEFDSILGMNTPYTIHNAQYGWSHEVVKDEVTPEAICLDKLPNKDTASYHVKPFKITQFVGEGYQINLGDRRLEVVATPGHTPDAIALLDKQNGYLFTGDSFYESTIWLFDNGTDLRAYEQSIAKMALLQPQLKMLYTSHNTPQAKPQQLTALKNAFAQIKSGAVKGVDAKTDTNYSFAKNAMVFKFNTFSFLINKSQLQTLTKF